MPPRTFSRMPARMPAFLAVAIAVLLTAGLVGLGVVEEDKAAEGVATIDVTPSSTVPGETTTSVGEEPLVPPELAKLVSQLQAFIEKARGLPFKAPVRVRLLDDKAFREQITSKSEVDKEEVAKLTRVLRALDLIGPDVDMEKAQKALLGGLVVGYYDLEKKELFVRGSRVTPAVRKTLVHELVHALQDQHFNVHRPDLGKQEDEAEQAFTALVEGDAVRIEQMYMATMSKGDQRRAEEQPGSSPGDLKAVPPILIQSLVFPYQYGPLFAEAVHREGGQARLDEAYANPPITSEHIVHPQTFLRGEKPAPVAEPPANGTVIDRGVFGEFGFFQQLQHDVPQAELSRAVAGWGGDRYIAWDEGNRTCVRVDVVMDTPRDADELRSALQRWVDKHPGASVTGSSPMSFQSCAVTR